MEKGLFSIIVPVYNRPDEVAELLASLREQTDKGFEIILVEDGSSVPCRQQAEAAAPPLQPPTVQHGHELHESQSGMNTDTFPHNDQKRPNVLKQLFA